MQEKLSKLKYKFKTEVKSEKSGYMLYAAVLAGILCIAVLKTGGKEQSHRQLYGRIIQTVQTISNWRCLQKERKSLFWWNWRYHPDSMMHSR